VSSAALALTSALAADLLAARALRVSARAGRDVLRLDVVAHLARRFVVVDRMVTRKLRVPRRGLRHVGPPVQAPDGRLRSQALRTGTYPEREARERSRRHPLRASDSQPSSPGSSCERRPRRSPGPPPFLRSVVQRARSGLQSARDRGLLDGARCVSHCRRYRHPPRLERLWTSGGCDLACDTADRDLLLGSRSRWPLSRKQHRFPRSTERLPESREHHEVSVKLHLCQGAVLRSRCRLGPPFCRLDAQGWRLLRIQASRCRLHADRTSARVAGRKREPSRRPLWPPGAGRGSRARALASDGCHGQGLRLAGHARRMRGARLPPDHRPDSCAQRRYARRRTDLRTWALDIRRGRLRSQVDEVALPDRRVLPKSVWLKAGRRNPLIPRETKRWRDLYRGRAALEREFGTLKHRYGLAPLRVRGLARGQLHADLTMLARLSQALARARAVPLAA
jgi:hypothetical protein